MRSLALVLCCLIMTAWGEAPGLPDGALSDALRMNQLQVVGTHNSYHKRPEEPLFSQVKAEYPPARTWDYSHAPFDVQFDRGVRSLELDVYALSEQGPFELFHVPLYDKETHYATLEEGLKAVVAWSRAHPEHVPISLLVELKDDPMPQVDATVLPFDEARLARLDALLRETIPADQLLTPDEVRGDADTLAGAVTSKGWPTLGEVRGRVFVVLHEQEPHRTRYLEGSPNLEGRPMFLRGQEGASFSAFFVVDDPFDARLPELVRAGYMVRTRADAELGAGEPGAAARREQAFASGAHVVSTDYPNGEADRDTGYVVAIPDGQAARINPVSR